MRLRLRCRLRFVCWGLFVPLSGKRLGRVHFLCEIFPLFLSDPQPCFRRFLIKLIRLWRVKYHVPNRGLRICKRKVVLDLDRALCAVEIDGLPTTIEIVLACRTEQTSFTKIEALLVAVRQSRERAARRLGSNSGGRAAIHRVDLQSSRTE